MSSPTHAIIDLSALQHNVTRVRHFAPQAKIVAMIKANAYGHGLRKTAKALTDVDALGVAHIEEALALREITIQKKIVLMEGFCHPQEIPQIIQHDFDCVIHSIEQIEMLEKANITKPISIWLKIDTGMNRLGFLPSQLASVIQRLKTLSCIQKPFIWMTHFSDADNTHNPKTKKQITEFYRLIQHEAGEKSLANSGGILAWPDSHADWVRPGIMLYGVSPFADKTGLDFDLKPVMTLKSAIIAIKEISKGETIGYGSTYTCPETMRVGVVAIGYGDGYPRGLPEGTPVLIHNKTAPLIGRVSMDMITVDLRKHPEAVVGDEVILWGKGLPVETIANYSNKIPYELLCGVTYRVRFVAIHH